MQLVTLCYHVAGKYIVVRPFFLFFFEETHFDCSIVSSVTYNIIRRNDYIFNTQFVFHFSFALSQLLFAYKINGGKTVQSSLQNLTILLQQRFFSHSAVNLCKGKHFISLYQLNVRHTVSQLNF